jgi:hypothetical protein
LFIRICDLDLTLRTDSAESIEGVHFLEGGFGPLRTREAEAGRKRLQSGLWVLELEALELFGILKE